MKKLIFLPLLAFAMMLTFSSMSSTEAVCTVEQSNNIAKCAPLHPVWSPCDHTFRFHATRGGSVDNGTYFYVVIKPGVGVVDSGNITNATNTNQVLSHCTGYYIYVYDWCAGWIFAKKVSDGCNNLFLC
ncbi:MAG TPA: hypothetical protein ENJ82_12985 [Bacteroidetes bacterium]|nr:hypothetical protein [Bacteroidota bacterium]